MGEWRVLSFLKYKNIFTVKKKFIKKRTDIEIYIIGISDSWFKKRFNFLYSKYKCRLNVVPQMKSLKHPQIKSAYFNGVYPC